MVPFVEDIDIVGGDIGEVPSSCCVGGMVVDAAAAAAAVAAPLVPFERWAAELRCST